MLSYSRLKSKNLMCVEAWFCQIWSQIYWVNNIIYSWYYALTYKLFLSMQACRPTFVNKDLKLQSVCLAANFFRVCTESLKSQNFLSLSQWWANRDGWREVFIGNDNVWHERVHYPLSWQYTHCTPPSYIMTCDSWPYVMSYLIFVCTCYNLV